MNLKELSFNELNELTIEQASKMEISKTKPFAIDFSLRALGNFKDSDESFKSVFNTIEISCLDSNNLEVIDNQEKYDIYLLGKLMIHALEKMDRAFWSGNYKKMDIYKDVAIRIKDIIGLSEKEYYDFIARPVPTLKVRSFRL